MFGIKINFYSLIWLNKNIKFFLWFSIRAKHWKMFLAKNIFQKNDFSEIILRRKPFYVETNGALEEIKKEGREEYIVKHILLDFKNFVIGLIHLSKLIVKIISFKSQTSFCFLGCVWDCDFVEKKCDFKPNRKKMNRLKTAFLKNCDLKTQKSAYSNRRQFGAFCKRSILKG